MENAISAALAGECIVYPTTTQPALGCLPVPAALNRLYEIKKRPAHMPVSLGVASLEQAEMLVETTPDLADFLAAFPEGALTVILRARAPLDVRLGGEKVAVRVVAHPVAKELLQRTGPLTATSANISGTPPADTCEEAAFLLRESGEEVALVEGKCKGGAPSTLISWHSVCDSLECPDIEVLREGVIPTEEVLKWWKNQI